MAKHNVVVIFAVAVWSSPLAAFAENSAAVRIQSQTSNQRPISRPTAPSVAVNSRPAEPCVSSIASIFGLKSSYDCRCSLSRCPGTLMIGVAF
jgi:hypothetical protein